MLINLRNAMMADTGEKLSPYIHLNGHAVINLPLPTGLNRTDFKARWLSDDYQATSRPVYFYSGGSAVYNYIAAPSRGSHTIMYTMFDFSDKEWFTCSCENGKGIVINSDIIGTRDFIMPNSTNFIGGYSIFNPTLNGDFEYVKMYDSSDNLLANLVPHYDKAEACGALMDVISGNIYRNSAYGRPLKDVTYVA